jgi:hypothetical protein
MDARLMLDAKYLKSSLFGVELPAEPILTIARVERATEQGDDGEDETWWVIHFREKCKPLKTNNTNTRCLIACFGNETDDWIGKRVQFYAMPGTWFGQRQTAVRIKAADIAKPISVSIKMRAKKGQKNTMIYEIAALPSSGSPPVTPAADPLSRVWKAWGDAGWAKDSAGFTAFVKSVTGKTGKELVDADVEPVLEAIAAKKAETT